MKQILLGLRKKFSQNLNLRLRKKFSQNLNLGQNLNLQILNQWLPTVQKQLKKKRYAFRAKSIV